MRYIILGALLKAKEPLWPSLSYQQACWRSGSGSLPGAALHGLCLVGLCKCLEPSHIHTPWAKWGEVACLALSRKHREWGLHRGPA